MCGNHRSLNHAQAIALYQPLLHRIAYDLLRCKADAEDVVQDTFLKWLSLDSSKIENTKAYLITSVRNNCLNHLNALRKKKEELWDSIDLSQLMVKFKESDFAHLDIEAELKNALAILHKKLGPLERAVYLLKEVFDVDYEGLQKELNKKADHCRQLLSRAKKKLQEDSSRIHLDLPDASRLFENFRKACDTGQAAEFVQHLKRDIANALKEKF